MKKSIFTILVLISAIFTHPAWGASAVPVSPGYASETGITDQVCPTFSWSAADRAVSYWIEVYEHDTANVLSHEKISAIASPVRVGEIPAPALSWTPSVSECLERSVKYVWYITGVDEDEAGKWSEGRAFQVEASVLSMEQKAAVEELIRAYLKNEAAAKTAAAELRGNARINTMPSSKISVAATRAARTDIDAGELITTSDIVNIEDVIVQGSLCVGLDCIDGEIFDFDTIRLKENNLRIKFEDTSASAGFPSNDWQLTINDSASGGADKFSIEDITGSKVPFTIRAGAPTNSIFVDSTGKAGFRTGAPELDLHILTGNTPAIRLDQDGTGGWVPQTWDIGANEANFFVRDVTGGSNLPFRIRPGAPTNSLNICASGTVVIGGSCP